MRIERHPIEHRLAQLWHDNALQDFKASIPSARKRASSLTLLESACTTLANCASVVAPNGPEIGQALRIGSQACAALFAIVNAQGKVVTVPLGEGEPTTYTDAAIDERTVNALRWLRGFTLATVGRDFASLKILCATPLAKLRASSTKSPEYCYLLIDALQRWHNSQPGVAELFIDAMRATEPDRKDIIDADVTLLLDVPAIQCLLYAVSEQPDFGEALAKGLNYHKKYWTKTDDLRTDWDGFLSFPLLAAATLAFKRKLPFDVDSEYLPMRLVKGEF